MKRKKVLYIALILCLCLTACSKSEAATSVDEQISDIGTVTLSSCPVISAAEEAVNNLSDSEKKQLDQLSVLEEARTTYNQLVAAKITEIESDISEIGTVSLEKANAIESIRHNYETSPNDVKTNITNYSELEKAESQLSQMQIDEATRLISEIGPVTLNSGDAISAANTVYNGLSAEEQAKVKNADILVAAREQISQLKADEAERQAQEVERAKAQKQAEGEAAVAKLNKQSDPVEGVDWYKSPNQPYYADSRSYMLPYIGHRQYSPWICLRFHYTGDNWIFFENITISIDGENYYKTFNYTDVHRDNDTEVWEWIDIVATDEDITMLEKVANSNQTIVRFQGDDYHYDLIVSASDKAAIADVLKAYNFMKDNY